jgi:hypothetical protein
VYVVRKERLRQRALLIAISGVASLIALGLAIYRWNFAYTYFGPAVVWRFSQPFLTAALIFAGFAGFQVILRRGEARHQVSTHPRGMLLRGGKRVIFIPWGSIEDIRITIIRYGLPGWFWGDRSLLKLRTNDGAQHRLTGALSDLHALNKQVKDMVFPRLMDAYRYNLAQGRPLAFGPIHLEPGGLQLGRRRISWDQIVQAEIGAGHLQVRYRENEHVKKRRFAVGRIPNADLCRQLIEQIEVRA